MDHFALPGDSLVKARLDGSMVRNFQGYSTHGGLDLISFGPSAISQVGDCFAQNERKLDDWAVALIEKRLPIIRGLARTTDDRLRAEIIDRIMCTGKLVFHDSPRKAVSAAVPALFRAPNWPQLEKLADDGLINWTQEGFEVTPQGLLFLRRHRPPLRRPPHPGRNQHRPLFKNRLNLLKPLGTTEDTEFTEKKCS